MNTALLSLKTAAQLPILHFKQYFIEPKSLDEATRRKEFIFNVLLCCSIALVFFASFIVGVNSFTQGADYDGAPPLLLFVPTLIMIVLLGVSRWHYSSILSYIFILIFLALGTYTLWVYGYIVPEGLLTYALVIVMASILISVRASLLMLALMGISLCWISYTQIHNIIQPDVEDLFEPLSAAVIIVYLVIFSVIIMVSWLYNRDIESSLRRARDSEAALLEERKGLEIKIRERTKELEQAQVEKVLQLYRFAEFGRLSATLLHELANPLTSVSLELEQLELKGYSAALQRARKGLAHMEEYVIAARRQLLSESELKAFDGTTEVRKVVNFLLPKARNSQVAIKTDLAKSVPLYGDSIRFDQIVANLIANAIDASTLYGGVHRVVLVSTLLKKSSVVLRVEDNGRGIPAKEIKKVFEPFYTTKDGEQGTGLGLYITKQAVEESFGGTISVKSSRRNTVFTVELPLHEH